MCSSDLWSLTPKRIPEMFVPRFMGYTNRLSLQDYWGAAIEGFHLPYVLSIYIGLPVLILVVASSFKSDGVLPLRARRLLLVSVVASTAVSMGRFLPFFHALYENVPVLHQFRYPIKLLGFTTIPLALLAAAGSHSLFGNETVTDRSSRGRIALWLIFALVAAFTAAFSLSHEFSSSFLAGYFGSDNLKAPAPLLESFLHASAVFLLSILVLQYRHVQRRNIQHMLFAVVVLLDLLIAGKTVNHYAPQQFLTATPQLAHQVRKRIDDGRYWRDQNPQNIVFNIPFNDALYLDHWNLETLYNYSGAFYDIKVVFHEDYDGLANKQIQDLRSFVLTAPWDRRLPMLSAAGVKLILSAENRTIPGLRKLGVVRNNSNTLFYLYENEQVASPVAFVSSWKGANSKKETLQALSDPSFDPRKTVILSGVSSGESAECNTATVEIRKHAIRQSVVRVNSACEGYLVFAETFFPGWKMKVDGRPAPIVRANHAFQAVFLDAGEHTIERYYLPASIMSGAAVSMLSCIFLAIIAVKKT